MKTTEQLQSSADSQINIDEKLVEEGISQLVNEINVLENWLEELEQSSNDDTEIIAARKSYHDMLQSRREMLSALSKHAKTDADTPPS